MLRLAATGAPSKEIARETQLSPSTVDTYLKNACRKLDIQGRRNAGLALVEHESDLSQQLGYQPPPVADWPKSNDQSDQAVADDGDRETGGNLVLREDRSTFGKPKSPKPWWHPASWGSDVDLSPREVAISIVVLLLGTAIAWSLVIVGAAMLPPVRLN